MPLEKVYKLVHTMPQAEYDAWWPTLTSDEVRRYAESIPMEKRVPGIVLQEQGKRRFPLATSHIHTVLSWLLFVLLRIAP
jgi:hypothetical protein